MRIGIGIGTALLLSWVLAAAAQADAPLKTKLGLDTETARVVDEIEARYRADFRGPRGDYNREQRALRRARKANDSAAIARHEANVATLEAKLREIILRRDDQVRAVLTPEQLVKFEEYVEVRNNMPGSSRDVHVLRN